MKRKPVILLISLLLIVTQGLTVQARGSNSVTVDDNLIIPYYEYISFVGSSLSIASNGKAVAGGDVYYSGNYNSSLTVELQRLNGSSWSTIKSWNQSYSGRGYHDLEEEYYVLSGYNYRVITTATIYNQATVLETASSVSSVVAY